MNFWKTYLTDFRYLTIKGIGLLIFLLILSPLGLKFLGFFALGYIIVDPVFYYFLIYNR